LKKGAACSDNNDVCCSKCQIVSADKKKVCTPSGGFCQKDSFCDGKKAECPASLAQPDGTPCGVDPSDKDSKCASGHCTSRSQQCLDVGSRNSFIGACSQHTSSCKMICQTDRGCTMMDAFFVNGTPCGWRGKCYAGQCDEMEIISLAYDYWIPLMIIGIILLLVLLASILRWFQDRCQSRRNLNDRLPQPYYTETVYPGRHY
jgi:hypothetical protein